MRGKWFLFLLAGAALIGGFPSSAAAQTADEYADEWTNARRGDRTWMERATEQLTTGLADRIFGKAAEGTMHDVVDVVINHVEMMRQVQMQPCPRAALEQAFDQSIVSGRKTVMTGAGGTLLSALGGARGGGDLAEFLGKRLADQIREKLQEQALDRFKTEMRDRMKQGSPEYFEDSDSRGRCTTQFRVVWDKAAERYFFIFAGDCQCSVVSCGPMSGRTAALRRWTLEGWGNVIPDITQAANGTKTIRFRFGRPQEVSLTADCCGEGDNRFRTHPANGPGNAWVGYERPLAAAPPQRTPTSGGAGSTTTGTPPAPPARRTGTTGTSPPRPPLAPPPVEIPDVPDGPMNEADLDALEQRVHDAHDRAAGEREAADRRLGALRESGAAADDIATAQAVYDAAVETHIRARAARDKINRKRREQQSSYLPPPRLDAVSAQLLAVHNEARTEVGVPPLIWDPQLAASAAAYGPVLSKAGGLVHAPRAGRENQRENLLIGQRGYRSPAQMVRVWTNEKRNYMPGIYPNVSRTGNWADVSHYTQVIWRGTTRVGCAIHSDRKWDFLICRYSPPGNADGKPVL